MEMNDINITIMVDVQFIQLLYLEKINFNSNNSRAGGCNQNLILFIRGNAISGGPNINGINKTSFSEMMKIFN